MEGRVKTGIKYIIFYSDTMLNYRCMQQLSHN